MVLNSMFKIWDLINLTHKKTTNIEDVKHSILECIALYNKKIMKNIKNLEYYLLKNGPESSINIYRNTCGWYYIRLQELDKEYNLEQYRQK